MCTSEAHLAHAYATLGVRSRSQLASTRGAHVASRSGEGSVRARGADRTDRRRRCRSRDLRAEKLWPKTALPHLRLARPKLEAVLTRPTTSEFAKRQARKALERVADSG